MMQEELKRIVELRKELDELYGKEYSWTLVLHSPSQE